MKKIVILGSAGSIGVQTLDVVSKMRKSISVEGLSVHSNIETLKKQIKEFKPKAVCIDSAQMMSELKGIKAKVFCGQEGLDKLVSMKNVDTVVCAIIGSAGLRPLLKAILAGKNIALANKESLIMAGAEIMSLAAKKNVSILPVDSEHSAIFQCINGERKQKIRRIFLTASGGPFYKYEGDFSKITAKQALDHPTWKMGKKITIDSATLMNKGLEAIEASVLFNIPIENIEILIHPQSIIHSMAEFADGSVLAQMSNPDMRLPIQYALTYPDRLPSSIVPLDLTKIARLEFYKPDFKKFPCLNLAFLAAKTGKTMPAVMNAANEIAVGAFLSKEILFTDIAKIVSKTMSAHKPLTGGLDNIFDADAWARKFAGNLI